MAEIMFNLEEELTCSICLSPFEHPVTTPCGHNFCQSCLDLTWKDSLQVSLGFTCPQCRTFFHTKPDLKKNTLLSNLVAGLYSKPKCTTSVEFIKPLMEEEPKVSVILCDLCMVAQACNTCMTCMASFCEVHVKPHRDNPIFQAHQLKAPVADLMERICKDHHKLMDRFCSSHHQAICVECFSQKHGACKVSMAEEQRSLQERELKNNLFMLDGKIEKTHMVISQMKEQQHVLKDAATAKKRDLQLEYRHIRELLDRDEQEALSLVDQEEAAGNTKLQGLMKRFEQNVDEIRKAKGKIESLLDQKESITFLQATITLPPAASFDPYAPRMTVDSKRVKSCHDWTVDLKNFLENILKHSVEKRVEKLKADTAVSTSNSVPTEKIMGQNVPSYSTHPVHPPTPVTTTNPGAKKKQPKKADKKDNKSEPPQQKPSKKDDTMKKWNSLKDLGTALPSEASKPIPSILSAAKRNDLLQYGTVLMLDHKTAHRRLKLTDNLTKATVSEEALPYPDNPARFAVCSQVLCTKGFSHGRHYWEVKMSSNNFCGLGLAYNSIDRKGATSRLGRNAQSWCVEWFNVKLSAWHNSSEKVLEDPRPSRVGVLLDCDNGIATFYNVADRAYPFHTFVFPFTEPVYPAFWIFSSQSNITLCKLTA